MKLYTVPSTELVSASYRLCPSIDQKPQLQGFASSVWQDTGSRSRPASSIPPTPRRFCCC